MDDKAKGSILTLLAVALLILVGYIGSRIGVSSWQQDAIRAGVARWETDPDTRVTRFVWDYSPSSPYIVRARSDRPYWAGYVAPPMSPPADPPLEPEPVPPTPGPTPTLAETLPSPEVVRLADKHCRLKITASSGVLKSAPITLVLELPVPTVRSASIPPDVPGGTPIILPKQIVIGAEVYSNPEATVITYTEAGLITTMTVEYQLVQSEA